MSETSFEEVTPSILDRTVDLTRVGWATLSAIVAIALGFVLRFAQLDTFALSTVEGRHAFQAYSFFRGSTTGPSLSLPNTEPAFLILQSLTFFLFGATDVVARTAPALLGAGIVVLAWFFWPFVGKSRALGMAVLAALSPTLLYFSRVVDVQIAVTF